MDILERAKIKLGMLRMGEPIKFGSDADLIDKMAAKIELLRKERNRLREALKAIASGQYYGTMNHDIARAALKDGE